MYIYYCDIYDILFIIAYVRAARASDWFDANLPETYKAYKTYKAYETYKA